MQDNTQSNNNLDGARISDVSPDAMPPHAQQARESVDNTPVETPQPVLPDKFKSVDDLLKAYNELEKKVGQKEEVAQESTTEEVHTESIVPGVANDAFERYTHEYNVDQKLSDRSYQELESAGYPRHVVDAYIAGNKARSEALVQDIGGMDSFNEMKSWAQQNMSQDEQVRINTLLSSQDDYYVKLGLNQLRSSYEKVNGNDPKLIQGGRPSTGSTDVYQSNTEVIRDMQNPKYRDDPAFRKNVQVKLARSKNLL